mgnify:CR=1 FL=1
MIRFKLVNSTNGVELGELQNIQCSSVSVSMLEAETASFKISYNNLPAGGVDSLQPYKSLILMIDDTTNVAYYGGFITKRTRKQSDACIQLDCTDVLGYFKRVYVPTLTYSQVSQTLILQDVIQQSLRYSTVPITVLADASTMKRDRTINETDNKTIYDIIDSFNGLDGGTELSHSWEYNNTAGRWQCIIQIADHIGKSTPIILDGRMFTDFEMIEDYTTGYGANSVLAYSTSGTTQLESSWHSSRFWGRPLLQYRWSPSSSITNVSTLNSYAAQKLADIELGTISYSFNCSLNLMPPFGVVWSLGDYMRFTVKSEQFKDIGTVTARAVGYTVSFSNAWTITPLLQ